MLTPLLTEEHNAESTEGAIDPLGLYAIADALAVRLAPEIRERQARPRFLTAIAVTRAVCSDLGPDAIASDLRSEPWQVFEWYVVEGLIRTEREGTDLRSVPGVDKARRAVRDRVPLSSGRYLKTPGTFGFHGVYRQLARSTGIDRSEGLGETGHELLEIWSEEQGLRGFHGSTAGPGRAVRDRLVSAVRVGLEHAAVARSSSWDGWGFFASHLRPGEVGKREADRIVAAIASPTQPLRQEVFRALVSSEGRQALGGAGGERSFHLWLRERCSAPLRDLLDAIVAYEAWARLLTNAFDDCRHLMSRRCGKVSPSDMARLRCVLRAVSEAPDVYRRTMDRLEPVGQTQRFHAAFEALGAPLPATDFVADLMRHHHRVQRKKPPNGKNPWVERLDDGCYVIRPAYLVESGGRANDSYVYRYRAGPLRSFADDLGLMGD